MLMLRAFRAFIFKIKFNNNKINDEKRVKKWIWNSKKINIKEMWMNLDMRMMKTNDTEITIGWFPDKK